MYNENNTAPAEASANDTMKKQSRWKSKVLWAAIAAQIIALLQLTGFFQMLGLDSGAIGDAVAGILQILVLVGVLNNPTDPNSY